MNDNEELKRARLLEHMEAADAEVNEMVDRFTEKFVDDSISGVHTTIRDIIGSKIFTNWKAFEEFRNPFFTDPSVKSVGVIEYCDHVDFENPSPWTATASVPDKVFCGKCYLKEGTRLALSGKIKNCCVCGNKSGKDAVTSIIPVFNIGIMVVMCGNCNLEVNEELERKHHH